MKRKLTNTNNGRPEYNEVVKDYFKLLKLTKQSLATIERHELRYSLIREDSTEIGFCTKVHQMVTPIVYMSLEADALGVLFISFGFEQFDRDCEFSHITSEFIRNLYKLTDASNTAINIERCINTDNVITCCSELYEVIEDRNLYHNFKLIPYKSTASQRKLIQAVA
jgi:hypothetical protein